MSTQVLQTIEIDGISGNKYTYWINAIGTDFKAVGGNYIFAKEGIRLGTWSLIYIGQTSDLSVRFDDHHKMPCIVRNGATHILAHTNESETARLNEETDIIGRYTTSCNG